MTIKPRRAGRREPRWRTLVTAQLIVLLLAVIGCGDPDGSRAIGSEGLDSPPQPSQSGSGDVSSEAGTSGREFWETVRAFPIHQVTRAAPPPPSLEALIDRSTGVVRGRVANVAVVEQAWAPQANLPGSAAEVVVRLTVKDLVDLAPLNGSQIPASLDWEVTAWQGDSAETSEVVANINREVGMGPVGGDVILYLSPRATNYALDQQTPAWFATSGMLTSGGNTAVLSLSDDGPVSAFSDLETLEAATRAIIDANG